MINFTEHQFNVAFSLVDDNGNIVNESYRNYMYESSNLVNYYNSSKKIKFPLNLKNCTYDDFYNNSKASFDQLGLNKFKCFDRKNLTIQGSFQDPLYQYIEYAAYLNKSVLTYNTNNELNLHNLSELLAENPVRLVLYFVDTSYNVYNVTHPIKSFISTYQQYIDITNFRKINLDFKMLQFSSYDNIFYENFNVLNRVKLDRDFRNFTPLSNREKAPDGFTLTKFYIRSSNLNIEVERQYQKAPDFLANISGLLSQVLLILYFFVSYVNRIKAKSEFMSRILKFKERIQHKNVDIYSKLQQQFSISPLEENLNNKQTEYLPTIEPIIQMEDQNNLNPTLQKEKELGSKGQSMQSCKTGAIPNSPERNNHLDKQKNNIMTSKLSFKRGTTLMLNAIGKRVITVSKKAIQFYVCEIFYKLICVNKSLKIKNTLYKNSEKIYLIT